MSENAEITDKQRQTLKAIRAFIERQKFPPTMQELGEVLGIRAASAHEQVTQLVRKGYLSRQPRKARSLVIVREPAARIATLASVPLLRRVAAGPLMLAEENVCGEVLVDENIARRGRCFALTVSGDSMINAGMADGDIVVVRQQPVAESGDIVVALIGDEATVKRLHIHNDDIELRPENPAYRPIPVGPDDELRILGKVVAVRRAGVPPGG